MKLNINLLINHMALSGWMEIWKKRKQSDQRLWRILAKTNKILNI